MTSKFKKWHKRFKIKSAHALIHRKAGWCGALRCVKKFADSETCNIINEELDAITKIRNK